MRNEITKEQLANGTANKAIGFDSNGAPAEVDLYGLNPDQFSMYFTDFLEGMTSANPSGPAGYFFTGLSHVGVAGGLTLGGGNANVQGEAIMGFNDVANAFAVIARNAGSLKLRSGARIRQRFRVRLSLLSNGVIGYLTRIGLRINGTVSAAPSEGVFFRYTDAVNGGRWEAVCVAANVETVVDTGILADTVYHIFEIDVAAVGPSAIFKIDGVQVANIITNIPQANFVENAFQFIRIIGGNPATVALSIDWDQTIIERTTPR